MSEATKQRFFKLLSLVQQGKVMEAETALSDALRLSPKEPNFLQLAAQVAERTGKTDKAVLLYERALKVVPNWFEATMNLARVYSLQKEDKKAVSLLEALWSAHPSRIEIPETLAHLTHNNGDLPKALHYWQAVLRLNPDHQGAQSQLLFCCRQMNDWEKEPLEPQLLRPQITTVFFDDPSLQKEAAETFIKKNLAHIKPLQTAPAYSHAIKRVGYLSSDFHAHATSWLIAELFTLHDRARFEVYAYSYGIEDNSSIRQRLRQEADHFVELNALTPQGCAEKIREDEIDILIDLKGHTQGARLDILAYRPAPLQLHWLGYPGTTGAPFVDGFIGDETTVPAGHEQYFTEKVLRLPFPLSYQINDRHKEVGPAQPKSAYGLPDSALVLASFNQTYKITPDVFSAWCDVLREIPDAVLWLHESNDYAPSNLKNEASKRGVNPARLFFAKPLPLPEHLARYHVVDLALDTFPVGGHTTTSDALWVGTPVITCAGQSFISRVAASLLTAAELPELITSNLDDYKALVIKLAKSKTEREKLRSHLIQKRITLPLFDTPRFVKAYEDLLLKESSHSL